MCIRDSALITKEKFRPKPTKPELLPLEVAPIEKKTMKSIDQNLLKDSKSSEKKKINSKVIKNNITDKTKTKLKNDFVSFEIHL